MARRTYARGDKAWGYCQRSGKRMLLKELVRDGHDENLLVAPEWYEPEHPQERLPEVSDPVTLRRPSVRNEAWSLTLNMPHYDLSNDVSYGPLTIAIQSTPGTVSIT